MKKIWNNPAIDELSLSETTYHVFGTKRDGGYIGDGIISGHLEFDCDKPKHDDCQHS